MDSFLFNEHYKLRTAVIEGEKTMTRRLIGNRMTNDDIKAYFKGYTELANKCAPYKINDVVAVAEPYKNIFEPDVLLQGSKVINGKRKKSWYPAIELGGWNNSMFISPEYMQHFVRITDVKVERLQDISEDDCLKEGVYYNADVDGYKIFNLSLPNKGWGHKFRQTYFQTPREAFAALIDKISGKGTWKSNPFVFAYTFKFLK